MTMSIRSTMSILIACSCFVALGVSAYNAAQNTENSVKRAHANAIAACRQEILMHNPLILEDKLNDVCEKRVTFVNYDGSGSSSAK